MFIKIAFKPVYTAVFFHSFTFVSSYKVLFIFCNMGLLILLISDIVRFSILVVGRIKKFSLWSFNVMKLLPVPLISILSMTFASLAWLIPSLFIFVTVRVVWILFFTKAIYIWRFVCCSKGPFLMTFWVQSTI